MFFSKKHRENQKNQKINTITDSNKTREILNSGQVIVDGNKRNSSGTLSYQVANLQMMGERERQEDSFAVINAFNASKIVTDGLFAIVCDGMGGMQDGKLISETAVQGFTEAFRNMNLREKSTIPFQLVNACYSVNRTVRELFGDVGGTTAALILIFDSELYWLAVGDSPIFLKRSGNLVKLNKDHIYLNDLYLRELENETIYKLAAETAEQKGSLTEYIGKEVIAEMDFNHEPLPLGIDDVVFVCSDGVSSYIDESEIKSAVDLTPKAACDYLDSVIQSKNNPAQDNYTCIIISCV